MIIGCPQCNRRYRLGDEYLNKYIRCVCSAVLKVTPGKIDSIAKDNDKISTSKPSVNTEASANETVKYGVSNMDSVIFPDLTNLIDLSQFASDSIDDSEGIPEIDQELPSFDDDSFDDDSFENEDTEARQSSLENIDVSGPE